MSIEQKFTAAVRVIRGLPKNGPYQPSYDMMLKFYAYFKQGTEGPCKMRRPAFWDVVGRAKYDAWKRLGEMPQEKAMEAYVEELGKIVETMSYTQNVADFYGAISELDNIKVEDLELIAPTVIKTHKEDSNSPLRELATARAVADIPNDFTNQNGSTYSDSNNSESSDDEYIDTVEDEVAENVNHPREKNYTHLNGGIRKKTLPMTEVTNKLIIDPTLVSHLVEITDKMKADMHQVNNRINVLEQKIVRQRKYPSWWPLQDVSPSFFIFTILWPVAVAIVFRAMQNTKLNQRGVGKRS